MLETWQKGFGYGISNSPLNSDNGNRLKTFFWYHLWPTDYSANFQQFKINSVEKTNKVVAGSLSGEAPIYIQNDNSLREREKERDSE